MEQSRPFANLFYFKGLCHIGGTEQFLYEMTKYDDPFSVSLERAKKLIKLGYVREV